MDMVMSICYQSETLVRADNEYLDSLFKAYYINDLSGFMLLNVAIPVASLTLLGSLALQISKTRLF